MISPSSDTYLCDPNGNLASTANRFRNAFGNIFSYKLYSVFQIATTRAYSQHG